MAGVRPRLRRGQKTPMRPRHLRFIRSSVPCYRRIIRRMLIRKRLGLS